MPVQFVNRSKQLVILELKSGDTVHLAPNEVSGPIEDFEVKDNARINKLLDGNWIEKTADGDDSGEAAGKKKSSKALQK
jgi:hypothetical protein